jgi:2-dehydro-3-deoxygalactonokinase
MKPRHESGHADAALIAIDWGSSNLRAALFDVRGNLLDRRESADGVFAVKSGDFASPLARICGTWLSGGTLPMLACGMIGSRQGIVEVPYVACPANLHDLTQALGHVRLQLPTADGAEGLVDMAIVPGLQTTSADGRGDVMRGEETQLLGAHTAPGQRFVMPGTHSKWVLRGPDGRVESFQTYMTGELFDLLRSQSSLSRVMTAPQWSPEAFRQGVEDAKENDLENLLFGVRTAGLMGRIAPEALTDYLSGLLIGSEIKAGLKRFNPTGLDEPITLLGTALLTERYAMAAAVFGQRVRALPGDAVFDGLLCIAQSAGLLASARVACSPGQGESR